jgi:hypothetical protein
MQRVQAVPERLIGVRIEVVAVAVQGELTEVCPARAATSLGFASAAIHGATAVCRRS